LESGWINEHVIATEPNGIEILIRDLESGQPISGLENQLAVELSFEGKKINLSMTEDHKNPGRYTYWIVPMFEGDYNLKISGDISGVPISTQFELPRVEKLSYERFPTTPGPSKFMPESERQDFTPIIYLSIGLAIVAIGIGSVALRKR
jgi:hypothetical protein